MSELKPHGGGGTDAPEHRDSPTTIERGGSGRPGADGLPPRAEDLADLAREPRVTEANLRLEGKEDFARTPVHPDTPHAVQPLTPEQRIRIANQPEYALPKEGQPGTPPPPRDVVAQPVGHVAVQGAGDTSRSSDDPRVQNVGTAAVHGALEAADSAVADTTPSWDKDAALEDARQLVREAYESAAPSDASGGRGDAVTAGSADGPRALVDTPDADERLVIEEAKAGLAARKNAGEVLGGDPAGRADLWHEQGRNELGYKQDCALTCTAEVLQDCGIPVTESDVVAHAAQTSRCDQASSDPRDNGGATLDDVQQLLAVHGVGAKIEAPQSPEDLARIIENGNGVIHSVNADMLRHGEPDPNSPLNSDGMPLPDHAVVVTGTVRDAEGRLEAFVINDTGSGAGAAVQVDLGLWQSSSDLGQPDGFVVTERPTHIERGERA